LTHCIGLSEEELEDMKLFLKETKKPINELGYQQRGLSIKGKSRRRRLEEFV